MIYPRFNVYAITFESTYTPLLRQTTNHRGVCEQTAVPGCAQTTLAALAKRQFGGLERHLCHTLELGKYHLFFIQNVFIIIFLYIFRKNGKKNRKNV